MKYDGNDDSGDGNYSTIECGRKSLNVDSIVWGTGSSALMDLLLRAFLS